VQWYHSNGFLKSLVIISKHLCKLSTKVVVVVVVVVVADDDDDDDDDLVVVVVVVVIIDNFIHHINGGINKTDGDDESW